MHWPGCKHGDACRFCHYEHDDLKKSRHRPCKATRKQCKQLLERVNNVCKDDVSQKEVAMQELADKSPYMRSLLKRFQEEEEEAREAKEPLVPKASSGQTRGKASSSSSSNPVQGPRIPGLQPTSNGGVADCKTKVSL
eukprot:gb/GFBE01032349.1/.p1 GENE.gb/GFBE01032349.1/~~gb/GFBE01032349.1/.p1  ORF type:complete len:138 (+),score=25.96 gb/GFBE01032349.1/:1-414(+)